MNAEKKKGNIFKIKINLNFCFRTSLWCHKTFRGTTKKRKLKFKLISSLYPGSAWEELSSDFTISLDGCI